MLSEHEQSLFACGSSQQAWKSFVPQHLAGTWLLKAHNDKMQCNLMQLQPCLLKVISELFSSVVMGTVSVMVDCCLMAPAVCSLDGAAQRATFAGEELIISRCTQPAEQLARLIRIMTLYFVTVERGVKKVLCYLPPPPKKKTKKACHHNSRKDDKWSRGLLGNRCQTSRHQSEPLSLGSGDKVKPATLG